MKKPKVKRPKARKVLTSAVQPQVSITEMTVRGRYAGEPISGTMTFNPVKLSKGDSLSLSWAWNGFQFTEEKKAA